MVFRNSEIDVFLAEMRFLWLLISLVFVLAVAPLIEDELHGSFVFLTGLTAVFATGLHANRNRRRMLIAGGIVAATALPTLWWTMIAESRELSLAGYLLAILFCGATAVLILTAVLKDRAGSPDAVLGALCVYLLMGLGWALAYAAVELVNHDAAFTTNLDELNIEDSASFSDIVYFSFVTMSTLGYGDISPVTPVARTLAWLQSVAGQFYLAILVARLINILPDSGLRPQKSPN